MFRAFIIADGADRVRKLGSGLDRSGFDCCIACNGEKVVAEVVERAPDLVLITVDGSLAGSGISLLARRIKEESPLPIIALLSKEALDSIDPAAAIDDFVAEPWDVSEVAARARRVLWRINNVDGKELIKCGNLSIDLGRCEVSLSGRRIPLTFKEYQLLKYLASNRGRVFTRDALLNKVWGYDYFGGERTVDVHIRRLRSKIEDANHSFIETVRNIGYKFAEG